MKNNYLYTTLFVVLSFLSCKNKDIQTGKILCGGDQRDWYYSPEDSINFSWISPMIYTFDRYGNFSKKYPKYLEDNQQRTDVYDHQWELVNDSNLIIAGYEFRITYISNDTILLYNKYENGRIDTLRSKP